ncbi:MAG: hypothetical protein ACO25B_00785 [Chitinophagaceae bacterium]
MTLSTGLIICGFRNQFNRHMAHIPAASAVSFVSIASPKNLTHEIQIKISSRCTAQFFARNSGGFGIMDFVHLPAEKEG